MQRVGYDADTQAYTYQDADGTIWEGEEGSQYGPLHRFGQKPSFASDVSSNERHNDWRYMMPFILLIGVVLLLVFRFMNSRHMAMVCQPNAYSYIVKKGDSCWSIGGQTAVGLDGVMKSNPGLQCDGLMPGKRLCVPTVEADSHLAQTV